jgi:hypothetical protein
MTTQTGERLKLDYLEPDIESLTYSFSGEDLEEIQDNAAQQSPSNIRQARDQRKLIGRSSRSPRNEAPEASETEDPSIPQSARHVGGRQSQPSKKQSRIPSFHAVLTGDARRPPSRLKVFDDGKSDTVDGNRVLFTPSATDREKAHRSNSSGHANRDTPVQNAAAGAIADSIPLALKRKKRKASPARYHKSRYDPYDRRG